MRGQTDPAPGRGMTCEACRQNVANYKFTDSHFDEGQTKVVCQPCYFMLSLHCLRQDVTKMNSELEAITKKVGADLG